MNASNQTKTISSHAAAAKMIRAELKKRNIKARATSDCFSMGNSVSVTVYDQSPAAMREIEALCKQYQYGRYDGQTDCYEYDNDRKDIPQAKYVSVENHISPELKQKAWEYARKFASLTDSSARYEDAGQYQVWGMWGNQFLYQILTGATGKFWEAVA